MGGLENYLLELARYGEPLLYQGQSGWYCSVDMRVKSKGTSFKISSDRYPEPLRAATECLERIREALKGFGELEDLVRLK